jgi:hypothetical protein
MARPTAARAGTNESRGLKVTEAGNGVQHWADLDRTLTDWFRISGIEWEPQLGVWRAARRPMNNVASNE